MTEKVLWELMEMEAVEKYYIDRPLRFRAELPGIFISSGMFRSPDAKRTENYTVWFGRGIAHWNFTSLRKARIKAKEILDTANVPIKVRVEARR